MALPTNADVIVVHGYWLDELTGLGVKQANGLPATIMFDPVPLLGANTAKTPNLRDLTSNAHLKTRTRVATVDPVTGYYATQLVASNDPDLDAYGGRKVTFLNEDPFTIEVPYNAPTVTVSAEMAAKTGLTQGSTVKAIWLPNTSVTTNPQPTPPNNYLTSTQTLATIASGIEAHDEDPDAHPDIHAVLATIPEQARDAVGAALVAGSGITVTVDDAANTITLTATGGGGSSYSDEQAQDAFAALLAAGTHSGISFAYNDAGNAISATVSAQSWSQITGKPTFAAVATSGSASDITTGTLPDGVIPAGIARDTEVSAAVAALVNSAPTTLDTLGEIATALQADESTAAALATTVGQKAAKSANLSDLANVATARANLGVIAATLINVKDYGATGDGTTDDSAAVAAARDAMLATRDASGHASRPGLYFPPGTYKIVSPDALMNPTSTAGSVIDGYAIVGAGKRVTTINFRPTGSTATLTGRNLMTWSNSSTGGRVRNFRCSDITFDSNNAAASFLYSYSELTSANYDAVYRNVSWSGSWNRVIGLDGSDTAANLNSEFGFYNCEIDAAATFADAFFNSTCTPGDTNNQQDQFVDYWFRDCSFSWTSGTLLKFPKGGSISVSGGSWSLLGATCLAFSMPFHQHNAGAQRLAVTDLRLELVAQGAKTIDCAWFGGIIEWINLDESPVAWQSWAPTVRTHHYDWTTYGNGPSVTYRGCNLMGYHEVATGSSNPAFGGVRYDGCVLLNYGTSQIGATTGASGLLRWTGTGVPRFSFRECFGSAKPIADVTPESSAGRLARWVAAYPTAAVTPMPSPPTVGVGSQDSYGGYVALPSTSTRVFGASVAVNSVTDSQFMYAQNITPLNSDQFASWALEFISDAPLFDLHLRAAGQVIDIYIDGLYVTTKSLPGGGANTYLSVNSGTRAMRHYRFESNDLRAAGIIIGNSADSIIPPGRRGPRVAVVGDSYTEGSGADSPIHAFPWVMARRLGWADLWQSGSGGTGYLATGAGGSGRVKYRDRIDHDVLNYNPDLVIVTGGRNDNSPFSDAAIQTEAEALFRRIKQTGAVLVVVGPFASGDPDSTILTLRDAVKAAAATAGADLFLDPFATPQLFNGTGYVGATTGTGNADVLTGADGVHPTQDGHNAIGRWLAARIAEAWR